jgi:hypothetical protein
MEAGDDQLRARALELLEQNLNRVETTPRRPIDPALVRTEADQAVVNVSVAVETMHGLGLLDDAERDSFFRRLRGVASTSYAPFRGVALRRVVVAPAAPDTPGLRLLTAELYDDGVVLRWVFVAPTTGGATAASGEYRPPEAYSLWDDAETAYDPQGGGWIPGHHLRGDTAFVPAVPDDATRLYVAADRHRFELDLTR